MQLKATLFKHPTQAPEVITFDAPRLPEIIVKGQRAFKIGSPVAPETTEANYLITSLFQAGGFTDFSTP